MAEAFNQPNQPNQAPAGLSPEGGSDFNQLGLKAFEVDGETQVVLAHKQLTDTDHYVFTHGDQPTSKLRCFKLVHVQEDEFDVFEMVTPRAIARVAQEMGINEQEI